MVRAAARCGQTQDGGAEGGGGGAAAARAGGGGGGGLPQEGEGAAGRAAGSRWRPSGTVSDAFFSQVVDHYENPRNVGSLDRNAKNVGTGLVGAPACGDVMKLQVRGAPGPVARPRLAAVSHPMAVTYLFPVTPPRTPESLPRP